jgi:kynureninase
MMRVHTTPGSMAHPIEQLQSEAQKQNLTLDSPEFATYLDSVDPLKGLQSEFHLPTSSGSHFVPAESTQNGHSLNSKAASNSVLYLCGNSLGVQPKETETLILQELQTWRQRGVVEHFDHPLQRPWVSADEACLAPMASIVGAREDLNEVAIMGTLTTNLHLLMVSFYKPTPQRYKILLESKAFPSDTYAVTSQLHFHGYADDGLIALAPRDGEHTLRHEDILHVLETQGEEIALVLFSGIQYYTGQLFNIKEITQKGQSKGCIVGWDLAHAVGNVPLQLHDWNVDFAAWCTYKYLNSGPGSIAGIFLHARYRDQTNGRRFAGWWGHDKSVRFKMDSTFIPMPGASGYQLSNPSVFTVVCLLASLNIYSKTSMHEIRSKSLRATAYLEHLIQNEIHGSMKPIIITPSNPEERGAQLSILFPTFETMKPLMERFEAKGIVVDEREPNVIRVAPAPLYNSYTDVRRFVSLLKECLNELK